MSIGTLTELAAAKAKELLARDGHPGFAPRLAVSGGGCSGLRYPLKFDEHAGELDHESRHSASASSSIPAALDRNVRV